MKYLAFYVIATVLLLSVFNIASAASDDSREATTIEKVIQFFTRIFVSEPQLSPRTPAGEPDYALPCSGGTGTPQNPIRVCTPQDLDNVRNNMTAHYKQMKDIDLANYNLSSIGQSYPGFEGVYDGNNFYISNYTNIENQLGIFRMTSGATLKNIRVLNPKIQGSAGKIGGLASQISNGTLIENCHVFNPEFAAGPGDSYIGGLIGYTNGIYGVNKIINSGSHGGHITYLQETTLNSAWGGLLGKGHADVIIINSSSSTKIFGIDKQGYGTFLVGGLVGEIDAPTWVDSIIESSFATGEVSGYIVGGLVGSTQGNSNGPYGLPNFIINNSYATGGVTATKTGAGFVGFSADDIIINSYSTGHVSGYWAISILSGFNFGSINVTSSYWNIETSGQSTSVGGEGRTTEQMTSVPQPNNTYVGWNFVNIWKQTDGQYPKLKWQI